MFGSQKTQTRELEDRIRILTGRQQMMERMYSNRALWTKKQLRHYEALRDEVRGLQLHRQRISPDSETVSSRVGESQTSFEAWQPRFLRTQ